MIKYNDIKTATAIYTGGGIYIYYGELHNGLYFRACDDWEEISICNADTSTDEADYCEFYEAHEVETITGADFIREWNNILQWIIDHDPDGNYLPSDLERRFL